MRSDPPRGGPGRRRYAPAVADDPATVADGEAATGNHEAATVADQPATGNHEAATVADQPATVDDEAATGGSTRGRSSAA